MDDRLTLASALSLRAVREDDRDFLTALYASTREEELRQVPWNDEQKWEFIVMQFDAQTRAYSNYPRPDYNIILARGEPAGRIYVSRMECEIRVVDIIVAARFRGRGLGTLLLRRLIRESEATRQPLTVHVERENPALLWYERLGFEFAGDAGTHYFMRRAPGRLR